MRTSFESLVAMLLAFSIPCAAVERRPNIVFILADDLGYRDLGSYGSSFYKTPDIDALALEGVRFTNAYAASPLCSPTRSSIMTGQHPARVGITSPVCHVPEVVMTPALVNGGKEQKCQDTRSITRLDIRYVTLAETLRAAGYQTAHFGKWHLGRSPYSPLEQGFDIDVPHYSGAGPAGSYIAPWNFPVALDFNPPDHLPDQHLEDRMAAEAVRFIRRVDKTRPFFLNYWAFSVHVPLDAKARLIDFYRAQVSPDPDEKQRNAMYAAMVHSLNSAVRTIVAELKKQGLYDNTVIVFTSDNGGVDFSGVKTTVNVDKRYATDDELNVIPLTSNSPLRGGKGSIYEGGVRVPLIIRGPGIVGHGVTTKAMIQSMDFYPTLVALARGKLPVEQPMDGLSFHKVLNGKAKVHRANVLTFFPHYTVYEPQHPAAALRMLGVRSTGKSFDMKLIKFFSDGPGSGKGLPIPDRYELYDMTSSDGEYADGDRQASEDPEMKSLLEARMMDLLTTYHALLPGTNLNYDPLQGWVWAGTGSSFTIDQGIVRLNGDSANRAFEKEFGAYSGAADVRIRLRGGADGKGVVCWSKLVGGERACVARKEIDVRSEWSEQVFSLDIPGQTPETKNGILTISLPPTIGFVEVDEVEVALYPGPSRRLWTF